MTSIYYLLKGDKMGRKKGSKNKTLVIDLNGKAQHFADFFIASEHINNAELLAVAILEKIRVSKKQLLERHGEE